MVEGNLALGGTLNMTNFGGLVVGTITLFTYTGTLSGSLALGNMPIGYKFVLSTNVAGQVNLLVAKPVIATTSLTSSSFIFTGTGGLATGNYFVLTSTNIALPFSNWACLATNHFDLLGNFQMTSSVATGIPNQFYLIQVP